MLIFLNYTLRVLMIAVAPERLDLILKHAFGVLEVALKKKFVAIC